MGAKRNLRYHIVLVSKYRRKVFVGFEGEVEQAVREASRGSAFRIEDVTVEDGNHVHILLRTTGTYSVSSMVSRLKALTTVSLWREYPDVLSKFYWDGRKRLWSGGYYATTIGEASLETVKKYLQKEK